VSTKGNRNAKGVVQRHQQARRGGEKLKRRVSTWAAAHSGYVIVDSRRIPHYTSLPLRKKKLPSILLLSRFSCAGHVRIFSPMTRLTLPTADKATGPMNVMKAERV
jgi:hypothetical protein